MEKCKVSGLEYTLDYANRFGIIGLVKNLPDGTVLLYAKGTNLEEFKVPLILGLMILILIK